jgi:hypothetical protein
VTPKWIAALVKMNACPPAVEWAEAGNYKTLQAAWDACERADWMCWLLVNLYPHTTGQVRLTLCACARTALRYVPAGEERPRLAIECAERYARGLAADDELAAARAAASDAAWDAARSAAWSTARSAAWSAALKEMSVIVRTLIPDPENLPKIEDMPAAPGLTVAP